MLIYIEGNGGDYSRHLMHAEEVTQSDEKSFIVHTRDKIYKIKLSCASKMTSCDVLGTLYRDGKVHLYDDITIMCLKG